MDFSDHDERGSRRHVFTGRDSPAPSEGEHDLARGERLGVYEFGSLRKRPGSRAVDWNRRDTGIIACPEILI